MDCLGGFSLIVDVCRMRSYRVLKKHYLDVSVKIHTVYRKNEIFFKLQDESFLVFISFRQTL